MAKKAAARKGVQEPEVLPVVDMVPAAGDQNEPEDQREALVDGTAIVAWLKSLGPFFLRALALEQAAKARLEAARKLKAPTTAEEDVAIQQFIQQTRKATAEVDDHWSITTLISRLHRRMTGRRGISTTALEKAQGIAQGHHNVWVQKKEAIAKAENDRLRREAEAEAQRQREADLQEAERVALAAEAGLADLSAREAVFVDAVHAGANPTAAATRAGYRNPAVQGARLMAEDKIAKALEGKRTADATREQARQMAQAPISAQVNVPTIRPDVQRAAGASDRTTHGAEVDDEAKLIAAVLAGHPGIPADILTIDRAKVNAYGKSLKERINFWPGVRYTKKTTTV